MFRRTSVLAALVVFTALPAMAQEFGGVPLGGSGAVLGKIESLAPGCPLSQTTVAIGVNQTLNTGALAQQRVGSVAGGASGCRPLVSTQVVAGANLAFGAGSGANQTITAQSQRGLLATNSFTRGVNAAVGARSSATQQLQSLFNH
jgi:hypothetical protein